VKLPKPPRLAIWLADHAIPGKRNEALAGDLFEQFSQGRSALWYWRQVLGAILVGYTKEWRVFAWAAAMTLVLAIEIDGGHYWNSPGARAFFGFEVSPHWLLSFLSATGSILLRSLAVMLFSASTYFGLGSSSMLMEKWKEPGLWRRGWAYIWKPLAIGYLVAAIATVLLLAILPARRHPILVANIAALVPVFMAVVVMTLVAPPNNMRTGGLTLFRINPPNDW